MSALRDPEKILFWLFVALLLWVPIPLGSNRAWAWSVLEAWTFLLLAAWIALWAMGRARITEPARRAWPLWILLVAWLGLQAAHVVPLDPSWVARLSPESARMQGLVADLGIERASMTLSIEPNASRISLRKSLAYCAVMFLAMVLVRRRSRLQRLVAVLAYAAVAHAIYAILAHLSGAEFEYFDTLISHGNSASGTFANRNHFAGYLEMSLALGIGLLIAGLSDRAVDSWRRFARVTIEWVLGPKMLLRLSLCILVIALTTTHSRSGNTAFFAALLVAGALGIALSRRATRNTVLLLASLVVIDLFIVGSWFGVEKLAQRLGETTGQDIRSREDPAGHALDVVADYALFGSGPGTFHVAFPRYRPESVELFYDYAHNDYAQFAAESGIIGIAILGLAVAASLAAALMAQAIRRDPLMRGISFASVMGVTAILIHSWTDFNLQIPSNAVYFVLLLSLGWIALFHDRHRPGAEAPVRVDGALA
jgi:O-antigen ligase